MTDDIELHHLATEPRVACLPASHNLATLPRLTLAQLAGTPVADMPEKVPQLWRYSMSTTPAPVPGHRPGHDAHFAVRRVRASPVWSATTVRYRWATARVCTFLAGGVRVVRAEAWPAPPDTRHADLLQAGLDCGESPRWRT
ncbi:hypothetical protein [Streptomyces sp. NPDC090114]|uniref:hypothetical protein n=1 Tax=Streptomyces sp. NPDC090114 TaxID=3365950 RepID=UPI00380677A6